MLLAVSHLIYPPLSKSCHGEPKTEPTGHCTCGDISVIILYSCDTLKRIVIKYYCDSEGQSLKPHIISKQTS